jgi:lysophospholipase L1-like esterase
VTPSVAFSYSPAVIIGTPSPSTAAAILTVGDSIGNGTNDTKSPSGFEDAGFLWRAYGSNATYVYLNSAVSGDTASQTVGTADRRRLPVWAYATHCVCEMGINEFADPPATMKAHLIALWTQISGNGTKVYQTTITPDNTSTDSWATTTNQTPLAVEANRTGFNDWIRAGAPMSGGVAVAIGTGGALLAGQNGHPLTGYFDVADKAESARNSGLWREDLGKPTNDGIHPNAVIHAAMKDAITLSTFASATPTGNNHIGIDIGIGLSAIFPHVPYANSDVTGRMGWTPTRSGAIPTQRATN